MNLFKTLLGKGDSPVPATSVPQSEPGQEAPTVTTVGHPIHVNEAGNSQRSRLRHLSRLLNLADAVSKPNVLEEKRAELLQEYERRILQLKLIGIEVPQDRVGVEKLIAQLRK